MGRKTRTVISLVQSLGTVLLFCCSIAQAGVDALHFRLQVLDAKTGKPVAGTHALVFYGESKDDLRRQTHGAEVKTDANGQAVLPLEIAHAKYVQVWIDWHRLCVARPDDDAVDLTPVVTKGVVVNHCSGQTFPAAAGVLTVAVREETFFEKMSH
jgi:hypothetical protein